MENHTNYEHELQCLWEQSTLTVAYTVAWVKKIWIHISNICHLHLWNIYSVTTSDIQFFFASSATHYVTDTPMTCVYTQRIDIFYIFNWIKIWSKNKQTRKNAQEHNMDIFRICAWWLISLLIQFRFIACPPASIGNDQ